MPLVKTQHTYKYITNNTVSLENLGAEISAMIAEHLQLPDYRIVQGNGSTSIYSSALNRNISLSGLPSNPSLGIYPVNNAGGCSLNFSSGRDGTYYTYTSENMILFTQQNRPSTNPAFVTNFTLFAKDKETGLIYCYFSDSRNSTAHYSLTDGKGMSFISFPEPKTSTCFMCNNITGNKISKVFPSIRCNPPLTKWQETIINGEEYFITHSNISIRLN